MNTINILNKYNAFNIYAIHKKYLVLLMLTIYSSFKMLNSHRCISDKIKIDLKDNLPPLTSNNRALQSLFFNELEETYKTIRIYVDYSNFLIPDISEEDQDAYLELLKLVVNDAILIFQKTIKVKRKVSNLKIYSCPVERIIIPDYLINEGQPEADLIIFLTYDLNAPDLIEAWATPCILDPYNKRPIAGVVGVTKLLFNNFDINSLYKNWETYITYALLHKITHILVFNNSLYPLFWDEELQITKEINNTLTVDIEINGINRTLIKSPKVKEIASKHFNCSDLWILNTI